MAIFTASEDLREFLGSNIIAGLEVTDEGTLDISWVQGQVIDQSGDEIVDVIANTGTTMTDDDTNYLFWADGSPTILTVKLTIPSGNEVLVATIVTAAGDIDSITEAGFDFSSVTGLSGRPVIRLFGDKKPPFFSAYGEIIIDEENLVDSIPQFFFRREEYRLVIRVTHDGDGSAVLKRIIAEMDSVFRTNNKLQTKTYHYDLKGSWDTNYRSTNVRMLVDTTKNMVVL